MKLQYSDKIKIVKTTVRAKEFVFTQEEAKVIFNVLGEFSKQSLAEHLCIKNVKEIDAINKVVDDIYEGLEGKV